MAVPQKVLVFHTAFIGDIILTLPLVQVLRQQLPDVRIIFVAIPIAAAVLNNHPAIDEVIPYDKKGNARGLFGMLDLVRALRLHNCDVALVPHRSIRSAVAVALAGIPKRIGFSKSAGRYFYTDTVAYEGEIHEIDRNLRLLKPLGISAPQKLLPALYPSSGDIEVVDSEIRSGFEGSEDAPLIAVAPGSVWNTKRWPEEKFTELVKMLSREGFRIALLGGNEDRTLCQTIARSLPAGIVLNAAGRLTLLQSAEMIKRSKALVSNDSAPMHMAVAVGTPVVAIFGATIPQFGFAPMGEHDEVVETLGLSCRPCSIHGGKRCPVKTFVCMKQIGAERVFAMVLKITARVNPPIIS